MKEKEKEQDLFQDDANKYIDEELSKMSDLVQIEQK